MHLEKYNNHLHKYPQSRIAKILGVYTFRRHNNTEPIHLMVMRNVASIPREFIVRTYDMKVKNISRS